MSSVHVSSPNPVLVDAVLRRRGIALVNVGAGHGVANDLRDIRREYCELHTNINHALKLR